MNKCRYCGKQLTRRFGHLERHEAECEQRPTLRAESYEDEPPRFRNAHPRVLLGSGVQVWKRG